MAKGIATAANFDIDPDSDKQYLLSRIDTDSVDNKPSGQTQTTTNYPEWLSEYQSKLIRLD